MQKKIEKIDEMIALLKSAKAEIKRQDKISLKARNMTPQSNTRNQIQKANTDLNWQCMDTQKAVIRIARCFKKSFFDVSTEETTFRPSAFHVYKF
jgi:hypothetical protein